MSLQPLKGHFNYEGDKTPKVGLYTGSNKPVYFKTEKMSFWKSILNRLFTFWVPVEVNGKATVFIPKGKLQKEIPDLKSCRFSYDPKDNASKISNCMERSLQSAELTHLLMGEKTLLKLDKGVGRFLEGITEAEVIELQRCIEALKENAEDVKSLCFVGNLLIKMFGITGRVISAFVSSYGKKLSELEQKEKTLKGRDLVACTQAKELICEAFDNLGLPPLGLDKWGEALQESYLMSRLTPFDVLALSLEHTSVQEIQKILSWIPDKENFLKDMDAEENKKIRPQAEIITKHLKEMGARERKPIEGAEKEIFDIVRSAIKKLPENPPRSTRRRFRH